MLDPPSNAHWGWNHMSRDFVRNINAKGREAGSSKLKARQVASPDRKSIYFF